MLYPYSTVQKPYAIEDESVPPVEPTTGTIRAYRHGDHPRRPSERRLLRIECLRDLSHQTRIAWLEWIAAEIVATTVERDHWNDRRWDDLPPEWEFKSWKARRLREKS